METTGSPMPPLPDEHKERTGKQQQLSSGDGELAGLRYRGWKAMPYVIGNETFEKLGTIGTTANLIVYFTTVFHMDSVRAVTLSNAFNGTTNLAPVLGAFLSDTYLGRYNAIAIASVASFLGMVILTLTAALRSLHPAPCTPPHSCQGPTPAHMAALLAAFAFLVVGAAGIRPCSLAFGADQFDPRTDAGRRGIASFFNWYYFTFTVAMMLSASFIIYIQSNINWAIGLAVPAALMGLSCALFFMGTRLYVRIPPEGSPFTSFAQVIVAAARKSRLPAPASASELYDPPHQSKLVSKIAYTDQFRWLDKAAIRTAAAQDGTTSPWRLCTVQQVEEVKVLARIMPVWLSAMVYYVVLTQLGSYTLFQAMQMDRRVGSSGFEVPPGSFVVFNMLALTLWLPVYDRAVVPALQRVTGREGGISQLQRIGVGLAMSVATMVLAAGVEQRRRRVGSSMPWPWLVPQQVMSGMSEAFAAIGMNEFCYRQFPENMRSVAGALVLLALGLASYASGFMVNIVQSATAGRDGRRPGWLAKDLNKGRVDLFYLVVGAIAAANLVYFVACAMWYRNRRTDQDGDDAIAASGVELQEDGYRLKANGDV